MRNPVSIPLESIIYPRDEQAVFGTRSFALRPFSESVQFSTCGQLQLGQQLDQTDYYRWTMQKMDRFGAAFEKALFASYKGCGLSREDHGHICELPKQQRRHLFALECSRQFALLFRSVSQGWEADRCQNTITLIELGDGRYTVHEGRHRMAVLSFLYAENFSSAELGPVVIVDRKTLLREDGRTRILQRVRSRVKRFVHRWI